MKPTPTYNPRRSDAGDGILLPHWLKALAEPTVEVNRRLSVKVIDYIIKRAISKAKGIPPYSGGSCESRNRIRIKSVCVLAAIVFRKALASAAVTTFCAYLLSAISANAGQEFVLRLSTTIPDTRFSINRDEGATRRLSETKALNEFQTEVHYFICRRSDSGYLIRESDENWGAQIDGPLDLGGGVVYARFGSERMFRLNAQTPLHRTVTTETMTNIVKNGFLPADETATWILSTMDGFGASEFFFEPEGASFKGSTVGLRFRRMPNLPCEAIVSKNNGEPIALDVLLTNEFNGILHVVGYHFRYGNQLSFPGREFDQVDIVSSNYTAARLLQGRSTQLLMLKENQSFNNRDDFGFGLQLSREGVWDFEGDSIKDMDNLQAMAARQRTPLAASTAYRNLLVLLVIIPPVAYLAIRFIKRKGNL